jgi:retinol dehydrogenase-12
MLAKTTQEGATNQIWAATCPDELARKLSGEYIVPFQRIGKARPDLDDPLKVNRLWMWCEKQGKKFD